MANIIGFYLFPFLFFLTKKRIKELSANIYQKKINHLSSLIAILYLFFFFFFLDITPSFSFGGGYSYKIATFFFKNIFLQKLIISIIFIFSFLIILLFANDNEINFFFIILYFDKPDSS